MPDDVTNIAKQRFKKRLMEGSMLADPKFTPPAVGREVSEPTEGGDYGVTRDHDDVVLQFGPLPPFRVPVQTAIKLALLILRRCGMEVDLG